MDRERAVKEFPVWAFASDAGEPKEKQKFFFPEWVDQFKRKHTVTIVGATALLVWTLVTCGITGNIVKHNTEQVVTDRLTHEWRANMQAYVDEQEQQRIASNLLTGEASLQAAIDAEAEPLARFINGYMTKGNATQERAKTAAWCVVVRVDNPSYPSTVQAVIEQERQWQFYDANARVRQSDLDLAKEVLNMWHQGRYPNGLTNEFVYMEWTPTDIVLRNTWEKNSKTGYWRITENA